MTHETFRFNLFDILAVLHHSDPDLDEGQITEAYDALIALGTITKETRLTPLQVKINETITSLAKQEFERRKN